MAIAQGVQGGSVLATPDMLPPGCMWSGLDKMAVGRHVWVGFSRDVHVGLAQQHGSGQQVGADRL